MNLEMAKTLARVHTHTHTVCLLNKNQNKRTEINKKIKIVVEA